LEEEGRREEGRRRGEEQGFCAEGRMVAS